MQRNHKYGGTSGTEEPGVWRVDYKPHTNFQLCRGLAPLTLLLFKGQQYTVFYVISLCVLRVYADTPGKFFVEELKKEEGEATRLLGQREREGWADFS